MQSIVFQEKLKNEAESFAALEQTLKLLDSPTKNLNIQPPLRLGRLVFAGKEGLSTSNFLFSPIVILLKLVRKRIQSN